MADTHHDMNTPPPNTRRVATPDDGQDQRAPHAADRMTGILGIVVDTPSVSTWRQR